MCSLNILELALEKENPSGLTRLLMTSIQVRRLTGAVSAGT